MQPLRVASGTGTTRGSSGGGAARSNAWRLIPAAVALMLARLAPGARTATSDSAVGVALAVAAAVTIVGSRRSRVGDVLGWTAVLWFAGNFVLATNSVVADLGRRAMFAHRSLLAHAAIAAPQRRPSRYTRIGLAAIHVLALIPSVQRSDAGVRWWAVLVGLAAIAESSHRAGASRVDRITPAALAVAVAATVVGLRGRPGDYRVAIVAVGAAVAIATIAATGRRRRRTPASIELLESPEPAFRAAFVDALADPGAEILFVDEGRWVDELGNAADRPVPGPGLQVHQVEVDGQLIAAVRSSPTMSDDPTFTAALATAATLAASHVRLREEVRRAAAEAAASRARVAAHAATARADFAAAVRSGPYALLDQAGLELRAMGLRTGSAATSVAAVQAQMHTLLAGLGPVAGAGGWLVPALQQLAARSPVDVLLEIEGPDVTGAAADVLWFVAAEGVSNVAKHTDCTRVRVTLLVDRDVATIEVIDDGPGGADAHAGSGLIGLADRVLAAGGEWQVESAATGTRLRAALLLPAGPAAQASPMRTQGSP